MSAGGEPVIQALTYKTAILMLPHVNPATTPASTMFLQGYGNRLTNATIAATPIVTLQLTILRFLVAWKSPIAYKGANRKWYHFVPFLPGIRVKDRLTTNGENLR